MKTNIKPVNRRPYGVRMQWDQHVARTQKGRMVWRLVKFGLVAVIVFGFLALAVVPLSFG